MFFWRVHNQSGIGGHHLIRGELHNSQMFTGPSRLGSVMRWQELQNQNPSVVILRRSCRGDFVGGKDAEAELSGLCDNGSVLNHWILAGHLSQQVEVACRQSNRKGSVKAAVLVVLVFCVRHRFFMTFLCF